MSTHSPKRRRWPAAVVIALTIVGVGLSIAALTRPARQQEYLCWDTPSSGPPAKYVVTFDERAPLDTTADCVRVPADLSLGDHVATVLAVDAYGQMSPPASLTFAIP